MDREPTVEELFEDYDKEVEHKKNLENTIPIQLAEVNNVDSEYAGFLSTDLEALAALRYSEEDTFIIDEALVRTLNKIGSFVKIEPKGKCREVNRDYHRYITC